MGKLNNLLSVLLLYGMKIKIIYYTNNDNSIGCLLCIRCFAKDLKVLSSDLQSDLWKRTHIYFTEKKAVI